jgi:hypothetical protein
MALRCLGVNVPCVHAQHDMTCVLNRESCLLLPLVLAVYPVKLTCQEAAAAANRMAPAEGAYVVPFIRAISDTSPTSQLNVTFLRTCASKTQATAEDNGQRRTTAAMSASA